MPPKHRFYEPIIQDPSPVTDDQDPGAIQLEAVFIQRPGVYLPLEGAIEYLRAAAYEWDRDGNPSGALALRAVADAWEQAVPTGIPAAESAPGLTLAPAENGAAPEGDDGDTGAGLTQLEVVSDQDVYRVEIFPDDLDSPRPRWHARSVDSTGRILYVTNGSFDQEYVIKDAGERWPGKDILLVADASVDSVWEEAAPQGQGVRGVLNNRRRPSPNRVQYG